MTETNAARVETSEAFYRTQTKRKTPKKEFSQWKNTGWMDFVSGDV